MTGGELSSEVEQQMPKGKLPYRLFSLVVLAAVVIDNGYFFHIDSREDRHNRYRLFSVALFVGVVIDSVTSLYWFDSNHSRNTCCDAQIG